MAEQVDSRAAGDRQVQIGYRITAVDLLSGEELSEPQVLAGPAAVAVHRLLTKLHAQSLAEGLSAAAAAAAAEAAAPAVTDAVGAACSSGGGGSGGGADSSGRVPSAAAQALAAEVLRLLPRGLQEQGPVAMMARLQEYLGAQQPRLGSAGTPALLSALSAAAAAAAGVDGHEAAVSAEQADAPFLPATGGGGGGGGGSRPRSRRTSGSGVSSAQHDAAALVDDAALELQQHLATLPPAHPGALRARKRKSDAGNQRTRRCVACCCLVTTHSTCDLRLRL